MSSRRTPRTAAVAAVLLAATAACSSSPASQPAAAGSSGSAPTSAVGIAASTDPASSTYATPGASSPGSSSPSASTSGGPATSGSPAQSSGSTGSTGSPPSTGTLLWTGDPSRGQSVFYLNNCDSPGAITTVEDPQKGLVWSYHKPAGDLRCESHGIRINGSKFTFQNNSTYYIGWWSKLSDLTNNNADFQWKSYGAGFLQNYPFVVSVGNGHAGIFQRQPDSHGSTVWSSAQPLQPNEWVHYVIGVHTSDQLRGGWIQLWFNGVPQTFVDGSTQYHCRTFDVQNDPKWGEYGAQGANVTNLVTEQKIGTSYDAVAN